MDRVNPATGPPATRTPAGTAAPKHEALEAVGVKVGKTPTETADLMRAILAVDELAV
ncbi:hypothetical protein [Kribbella sp. NBC_00359]|uniref:hypothetical protein n=1 Tax=Kribbella sp. NBC_00359 TaxID=2975966 RepID=UPI002E2310AB